MEKLNRSNRLRGRGGGPPPPPGGPKAINSRARASQGLATAALQPFSLQCLKALKA